MEELSLLHRPFLSEKPMDGLLAPSSVVIRSAQLPSRVLRVMYKHFALAILLISIPPKRMSSCFCRRRRQQTLRTETAERLTTATAGYLVAETRKSTEMAVI